MLIHQVGPLGARPPTVKRTLSAMAHDDKISADVSGEVSDFFRWLASHQLCHRVKAQLSQSCNALIENRSEVIFHPNGCSSESHLGQQQRTGIAENG